MNQPTPRVSRADVERIALRDFSSASLVEVLAIVDEYGAGDYHREKDRVQLAVLKLAGGNRERLRRAIEKAKRDYRDVLSPAEYPTYTWDAHKLPPEERNKIIAADWEQYTDWLNR